MLEEVEQRRTGRLFDNSSVIYKYSMEISLIQIDFSLAADKTSLLLIVPHWSPKLMTSLLR